MLDLKKSSCTVLLPLLERSEADSDPSFDLVSVENRIHTLPLRVLVWAR